MDTNNLSKSLPVDRRVTFSNHLYETAKYSCERDWKAHFLNQALALTDERHEENTIMVSLYNLTLWHKWKLEKEAMKDKIKKAA